MHHLYHASRNHSIDWWGEVAAGGAAAVVGVVSLPLIKAQPPSVAATDAAVISSFTPGALVLGFLTGLLGFISFTLEKITFAGG